LSETDLAQNQSPPPGRGFAKPLVCTCKSRLGEIDRSRHCFSCNSHMLAPK